MNFKRLYNLSNYSRIIVSGANYALILQHKFRQIAPGVRRACLSSAKKGRFSAAVILEKQRRESHGHEQSGNRKSVAKLYFWKGAYAPKNVMQMSASQFSTKLGHDLHFNRT